MTYLCTAFVKSKQSKKSWLNDFILRQLCFGTRFFDNIEDNTMKRNECKHKSAISTFERK
jgi:hypothetical protein